MYLYKTPLLYLKGGGNQFCLRLENSFSVRSTVNNLFSASMVILSPSFKRAIGPPTWASGVIWPIINP
jgi:hypothetical protein